MLTRWVCMMLTGIMLLAPCIAEVPEVEAPTPVEAFDSKGYTGAWVRIPEREIEFFLPEGWTAVEPEGDAAYAALNAESTAGLSVGIVSYSSEPLSEWVKKQDIKDGPYSIEVANGQEVAVMRSEAMSGLTIFVPFEGTDLVYFRFERDSEDALSDAFALAIAGTVEYSWD